MSRLDKGKGTIEKMIRIYCHDKHDTKDDICLECQSLVDYAFNRIENCPFGEDKPTCSKCTIHCYKSDMRERITEVMRYAGPKMIYKHPVDAFAHLLESRKKSSSM